MSLEKVYRRDSFSDRFCDDLAEDILQCLPFKGMFRLECVSKQFQRTVYKKHYFLDIDIINLIMRNRSQILLLERILKKLPNIRSLHQKDFRYLIAEDILTIVENCHHLTAVKCDLSDMSEVIANVFVGKYSYQLVSIVAQNKEFDELKDIQIFFPNIKELNYLSNDWTTTNEFFWHIIPSVDNFSHLKNMKKISIRLSPGDCHQIQDLQTFFKNNKSITHLGFSSLSSKEDTNKYDFTHVLYKEISKLEELVELEMCGSIPPEQQFKEFANNCHKLKSLIIVFNLENISEIKSILNHLKCFKRLQRLVLKFTKYHSGIELILNETLISLKSLTHFELKFLSHNCPPLKETLLTDFDKYLPKLKKLFIKNQILVTRDSKVILSRLSYLESLHLVIKFESVSRLIKEYIQENCGRIKSVLID